MPNLENLKIKFDATEINEATEKANQLVKLLREAKDLINSLSIGERVINVELAFTEGANGNANDLIKKNNDFSNIVCGV